jgi:competence protein ComEA
MAFPTSVNDQFLDQAALASLKGLDPVMAKAIIDERTENGPFKNADDLMDRVRGLSPKLVSELQEQGLII